MPRLYHGARWADAVAMAGSPGTIDVTRGGGEFGRGFYAQDSNSIALTWVQHRVPAAQSPCLLQLDVDDQQHAALSSRTLTRKKAINLTKRLRAAGTTGTHLEGVDVVIGPLNGSNWIEQQKFESGTAQTLLNGANTQRAIVCTS